MANDILGRDYKTIKSKAMSIIASPDFFTKEEVKAAYYSIAQDKRIALTTRRELESKLKKIYKSK